MAAVGARELLARAQRMRELPPAVREAAIADAGNVVGHDLFLNRHRRVELEREYKRTFKGKRP